jgi:hypothetical protein
MATSAAPSGLAAAMKDWSPEEMMMRFKVRVRARTAGLNYLTRTAHAPRSRWPRSLAHTPQVDFCTNQASGRGLRGPPAADPLAWGLGQTACDAVSGGPQAPRLH